MKTCLYAETLLDKVPKVLGCGMTNSYKYVGGACHTSSAGLKCGGRNCLFVSDKLRVGTYVRQPSLFSG